LGNDLALGSVFGLDEVLYKFWLVMRNFASLALVGIILYDIVAALRSGKINDVGAYTRQNVANSYRAGLELQLTYTPINNLTIYGNVTLSKNEIKLYDEFIDDYDNGGQIKITHQNTDIAFSPSIISNISFSYSINKVFNFGLINKFVSKQYLDNTQNENRKLNGYFTQDVLFSFTPTKNKFDFGNIVFQINNLFSKKYEPNGYTFSYQSSGLLKTENYYYPMAGINFMLGVNIKLSKK
jgi:iron complex outermembrane receptor protein